MKNRQAGVTMLEVIIAAVLLAGVFAMTFAILGSSSESAARAQIQLELEDRARRVITEITQDLRQTAGSRLQSGGTTISQGTATYTDLQFRLPTLDNTTFTTSAWSADQNAYWTRQVRYRLVMDTGEGTAGDNIDNNTNGVIDEQAIQKVEQTVTSGGAAVGNAVTSVICRDVQEGGLVFQYPATGQGAGKVSITLTLEKRDPRFKTSITKTVQTFVDMRN